MEIYLPIAVVLSLWIGYALGNNDKVVEQNKHHHDWDKWEVTEAEVYNRWKQTTRDATVQFRQCQTCGKIEIRKLGVR